MDLNSENLAIIRHQLIHILQMAYSGEKSAALAYQGHAGSVSDSVEKAEIQQIEADEWDHRTHVGQMLDALGGAPHPGRELLQVLIGRIIKPLCYVTGWFLPMLGAWLLEEANIREYEKAACLAEQLDLLEMATHLRAMGEREADHARYFKQKALSGQSFLSSLAKPLLESIVGA